MMKTVLAAGLAILAGTPAWAQDKASDWQVVSTFRDGGEAICQLRLGVPDDAPTLQIEGRTRNGGPSVVAYFRLGNLPRLAKAAEAQFTDVGVSIGGLSAVGAKATWTRGADTASSRLTFFSNQLLVDVLAAMGGAESLTVSVPVGGKATVLTYALAGGAGPLRAMEKCLAPDVAAQ